MVVKNVTIVLTFIGTLFLGVLFSTTDAKADTKDNSSYEYSYYCESDNICSYEYQIQWGDTLSQLSIDHQMRIAEIVRLNNIKNPDLIFANDYLIFLKQSKNTDVSSDTKVKQKIDNKEKTKSNNTKTSKKNQDNKTENEKETPTIRNIVKENPFSKRIVSDYSL